MPDARPLQETDYQAAAERSLRRYPGPVGELLYRELSAYARFGHRFAAADALMQHLTAQMLEPGRVPPPLVGTGGDGGDYHRPTPGPELWPSPLRGSGRERSPMSITESDATTTTRKDPPWSTS